jgi:hypothetical protein
MSALFSPLLISIPKVQFHILTLILIFIGHQDLKNIAQQYTRTQSGPRTSSPAP